MTLYVVGGAIGAVGLLLVLAAIFFDRARGRRRCPKCWYDMGAHREHADPACPECGHHVKDAKRLRKTRRHPWIAMAGVVILLAGAAVVGTEGVRRGTWVNAAPTTVLIFLIPSVDDVSSPIIQEFNARMDRKSWFREPGTAPQGNLGDLWSWQRWLLAVRCARAIEDDRPRITRVLAVRILAALGPDGAPAAGRLLDLVRSRDRQLGLEAVGAIVRIGPVDPDAVPVLTQLAGVDPCIPGLLRTLGGYGPDARSAVPVLIGTLRQLSDSAGRPNYYGIQPYLAESVRALGTIGPDAAAALPDLIRLVNDPTCQVRGEAVTAIGKIDATRPEAIETIIDALQHAELTMRNAAADVVRERPALLDRSMDTLVANLEHGSAEERIASARSLMTLGPDARSALPALRRALVDPEVLVRQFAGRAILAVGSSRGTGVARSEVAIDDRPIGSRGPDWRKFHDYDDFSVASPDGRYRLDVRALRIAGVKRDMPERHFRYALHDVNAGRILWERDQRLSESAPMTAFVHDEAWVVIWTGDDSVIVLEAVTGRERLRFPILGYVPPDERDAFVRISAGDLDWSEDRTRWSFLGYEDRLLFVIRTAWGRRIIVDLARGALVAEPGSELIAACVEDDRQFAITTLESACDRLADVDWMAHWDLETTIAAVHIAGCMKIQEAVPSLQELLVLRAYGGSVRKRMDVNSLVHPVTTALMEIQKQSAEPSS